MCASRVVAVVALALSASALRPASTATRRAYRSAASSTALFSGASSEEPYTLVLVRHGESTWNDEGLFTGWYDCPLSVKGRLEAFQSGELLKAEGFGFDLAYTSMLKRAISTLWIVLEELDLQWIPVVNKWRLNERHYGALQGKDKKATVAEFGDEQVQVWRRSYDVPPPPCEADSIHHPENDKRYAGVAGLPSCESLALTEDRVLIEWEATIKPDIIAGKRVLIAAHGNTLRALVKMLDGIAPDVIAELNIPTGVPLVYQLDRKTLKSIPSSDAIAPLTGRYLGNQDEVKNRIGAVAAQSKVAPVVA